MALLIQLFTGQAITATGNESSPHSAPAPTMSIELVISPVTGTTPSATFAVQWSEDGTNFAGTATDVFPAITAAGNYIQTFSSKAPYFRLAWTVTGTTPSFTTSAELY